MGRHYTFLDRLLGEVQNALLTVFADSISTERENPSSFCEDLPLTPEERRQSAGFMRVNHTGEVCAQALYRGQAWSAKEPAVTFFLEQASKEEQDHLGWCHERLQELGAHRSFLNIYWYGHSFFLGWLAGQVGDSWSLSFVEETEIQVSRHLQDHLKKLSPNDQKSFAIIEQMELDESLHASKAKMLGAKALPSLIKAVMQWHSKIMTTLVYAQKDEL